MRTRLRRSLVALAASWIVCALVASPVAAQSGPMADLPSLLAPLAEVSRSKAPAEFVAAVERISKLERDVSVWPASALDREALKAWIAAGLEYGRLASAYDEPHSRPGELFIQFVQALRTVTSGDPVRGIEPAIRPGDKNWRQAAFRQFSNQPADGALWRRGADVVVALMIQKGLATAADEPGSDRIAPAVDAALAKAMAKRFIFAPDAVWKAVAEAQDRAVRTAQTSGDVEALRMARRASARTFVERAAATGSGADWAAARSRVASLPAGLQEDYAPLLRFAEHRDWTRLVVEERASSKWNTAGLNPAQFMAGLMSAVEKSGGDVRGASQFFQLIPGADAPAWVIEAREERVDRFFLGGSLYGPRADAWEALRRLDTLAIAARLRAPVSVSAERSSLAPFLRNRDATALLDAIGADAALTLAQDPYDNWAGIIVRKDGSGIHPVNGEPTKSGPSSIMDVMFLESFRGGSAAAVLTSMAETQRGEGARQLLEDLRSMPATMARETPGRMLDWDRNIYGWFADLADRALDGACGAAGAQRKTLVVAIPSVLSFSSLHLAPLADGRRLVECVNIRYVSDLGQAISTTRLAQARAGRPRLAGVWNPSGDLTFADTEQALVTRHFTAPINATSANSTSILDQMGGATYWHFATHGVYSWSSVVDSALVLQGGQSLRLETLYDLRAKAPARLVFLSACETSMASSGPIGGDALRFSFPAAFLNAGSAGVIATLWPVDDFAATLVAGKFYDLHIQDGVAAPEALARATLWLSRATKVELRAWTASNLPGPRSARIVNALASAAYADKPFGDIQSWGAFIYYGS